MYNTVDVPHKPFVFPTLTRDRALAVLLAASGGDKKRTVRAGRRRGEGAPSGAPSSEGRRRATAPQRRRETAAPPPSGAGGSSGSAFPPAGGSLSGAAGGGLSGGGLPMGKNSLIIIVVLILLAIFGGTQFLGGGGDGDGLPETDVTVPDTGFPETDITVPETSSSEPVVSVPQPIVVESLPAAPLVSLPAAAPASDSPDQTWTIMLYQDADDKILEQDIYIDLNEAERVGSSEQVNIVAQIDRYRGGYAGDGDWTSARRYYVTRDDDLQRVGSRQVMDLGEVSMGDTNALIEFVAWAAENYPADKYVLIMSDHGMGWPGGWTDKDPGGRGDSSIPLSSALGQQLYLHQLDAALAEIRQQTGIAQFELIGMDACLMGHLEVFTALAPHARYAVASQEVEPALGWAYAGFLSELAANPGMSGGALAQSIVDTYIVADQRLQDEAARAQMYQRGSPLGSLFSLLGGGGGAPTAAQAVAQMEQTITLTAVDLTALPDLVTSVNDFAYLLQEVDQRLIAKARNYAQSFTNVFGGNAPSSYIDLAHFVQLLQQESGDVAVDQSGGTLLESLSSAVIAEKSGSKKPGANGISIYFPNSQLYQHPATGMRSYTAIADRFAAVSLWDDFLTYHYTGQGFDITAAPLDAGSRAESAIPPGAGNISASPVAASADVVAPGEFILLSSDISGDNIGHIYIFAGYYDQAANSIFVADTDYLESETVRQLEGIYYPDWGAGDFTLEFEWEPIVYAISDGVDSLVTLLSPLDFGRTQAEATYTIEGYYTFASGEQRYAMLLFQDGVLIQVLGFSDSADLGSPREITPEAGDTFTILEQWLDLDANGRVVAETTQEGGTLIFGDQMFFWEELDAAPGPYVVGFIVEDLDGNRLQTFTTVTVE